MKRTKKITDEGKFGENNDAKHENDQEVNYENNYEDILQANNQDCKYRSFPIFLCTPSRSTPTAHLYIKIRQDRAGSTLIFSPVTDFLY